MTLPRSADVVVVGSGIVGAACAAALAARGASVVLLEKEDGPAREGSGRAQGSLRVQGRHRAEFPLAREALELWTEAAEEGDFELVVGGNLYIRTTEDELPVLKRLVDEAHQAGLTAVELLDADQTRAIIPCATGPFLGAMWNPVTPSANPRWQPLTTSAGPSAPESTSATASRSPSSSKQVDTSAVSTPAPDRSRQLRWSSRAACGPLIWPRRSGWRSRSCR